tara:strand:+ start:394 stop:711 length:318 start_codon:yes stop_codon:yes gene_type:complete
MGTPYKMKGSPMARNFGAPFKKDGDKIDLSKKTDKEVVDVAKRNLDVIKKQGDNSIYIDENSTQEDKMDIYMHYRGQNSLANDSIDASRDELRLRYDKKAKAKKK